MNQEMKDKLKRMNTFEWIDVEKELPPLNVPVYLSLTMPLDGRMEYPGVRNRRKEFSASYHKGVETSEFSERDLWMLLHFSGAPMCLPTDQKVLFWSYIPASPGSGREYKEENEGDK